MIKSIQILRAIAAISVVFYHFNFFNFKVGDFGVDIFFIISGFIIAHVVNKTTKGFLLKRIIRVSPLYYLATFITIFLALLAPSLFKHAIITPVAIIKSFLYIPYRIGDSGPILSLGWTLNNEMLFYSVMFSCIVFFRPRKYVVPACGGLLMLFVVALNFTNTDNYIFNFYKNGLLPEFIMGLGLYYFNHYYKRNFNQVANYSMLILGILSFVLMIRNDMAGEMHDISRNLYLGVPALFFINALLIFEDQINKENKLVKLGLILGDASYAMYLFHPFIVFFLQRIVYTRFKVYNANFIVQLIEFLIALVLVCWISILLFDFIDKPLIQKFKRKAEV